MGTKLEELQSGCFHAALPDEPMFVLLARDPQAPVLVKRWADDRAAEIYAGKRPASDMDKVTEARECAQRMTEWRDNNDGAWRTGLFAPPRPIDLPKPGDRFTADIDGVRYQGTFSDHRPANCRNRLRDQGEVYPRSGCDYCVTGGMMGCPFDRTDPTGKPPAQPHNVRQESDEYACSCGARWDVSEGEQHP